MPLQDDLFGGEAPDPIAWVILVAGVIVLILCVWFYAMFISTPADAREPCWQHGECTTTGWRLELNGFPLSDDGLSKSECGALYDQIEPQAPPFSMLQCVEVNIARQTS